MIKQCCDLQNFNYYQRQITRVASSGNFLLHSQLIVQIIELPFQQNDILTLLIQCLNNLAVCYYRFDLFADKIFKFIKTHLLKNGKLECNLLRNQIIRYIVELNRAKMKCQLKQFGKAFLITEQALRDSESEIFKRLKLNDSKVEDAMLLINGYLILVKSYSFASEKDLNVLKSKSQLAQSFENENICKFYQNAKQLAQKYLGPSHPIMRKLQWSSTHRIKRPITQQPVVQQLSRQELIQLNSLLKLVKGRIERVQQPERIIYRRTTKNSQQSVEYMKSQSTQNSQFEISKPVIKKFQVKRKRNSNDDINLSNETTKEKLKKFETPRISEFQQIESLIQRQVEEQLALRMEYNRTEQLSRNTKYDELFNELSSLENTKKQYENVMKEQGQNLKQLQEELFKLKEQAKLNDQFQQQQQTQIEMLKANNLQLLQKKRSEQDSIKTNTLIREFQISSEQKNTLSQSALKKNRNSINEFVIPSEQSPIKIVNALNGVLQTSANKNSIEEFQASNKKSSPPFSFSFHKQQQQQKVIQEYPDSTSQNNIQENTIDQLQQWPSQKVQNVSLIDIEDSMAFQFLDQFSQMTVSIPFVTNEIYSIDIVNDLKYSIEISLISNKENARLEDLSLLIQANINSQRISELIEISQLSEFLQHTTNNCNLPFPLKFITTYKLFIQYLLLPFIEVTEEASEYKIVIWPQPQGLINEQSVIFFSEQSEWWIHFLSSNQFRIAIVQNKTFCINIETTFDQVSFDEYFEYLNEDEYDQNEVQSLLNKNNKKRSNNIYKLQSIRVKDKGKLINFINKSLGQMELFLKEEKQQDIKLYLQKNVVTLNLDVMEINKPRVSLISNFGGKTQLRMKNIYQTYQSNKQLGDSEGTMEISDEMLATKFHVDMRVLSELEKQMILQRLSNHFSLFSYDSYQEGEELDFKNESPIQWIEQNFGGFTKTMINNQYKIPVHFTLIGIQDKPEFVRIDIYNPETIIQNGILFFVNEQFWKKQQPSSPAKKQKQVKYHKEFAISEKYCLSQILQDIGWKVLEKLIIQNEAITLPQEGNIFRLEQYLNWKSTQEV